MEYNEIIKSKIEQSRIYHKNHPELIKNILGIPRDIDLKNLDNIIEKCYDYFYLPKTSIKLKEKKNYEERINDYLNFEKENIDRVKEIPPNVPKTNYRRIIVINSLWLKKTHKLFNKILTDILLTPKIRGIKPEGILPYLHSSVKRRSFLTNAVVHTGKKYVFAIDLKDFYPSVTKDKIIRFFIQQFKLDKDTATIYAILSTCPDERGVYRLAQGFSQSATLAFLVNYTLFNFLYEISRKQGIEMSVYVDDVIFSSKKEIPQEFMNRLFKIIEKNGMKIKNKKVKYYRKDDVKKITGIYVKGKKTKVSNSKHHEIHIQYQYLKEHIVMVNSLNDYYYIYNLYLKFYGNYQHILMVEKNISDKYKKFIDKYDSFFPKGINKNNSRKSYSKDNVASETNKQKLNYSFQKLKALNMVKE